MDYIFTTFFTKRIDPQKALKWVDDDFNKMSDFYNSILKNKLNCIIFHDNLSSDFIKKYENENIKFELVDSSNLNSIDVRWFIYKDYLEKNKKINKIFCLDISDVVILKNPFLCVQKEKIYCGDEEQINEESNWISHCVCCLENKNITEQFEEYKNKKILNAGILGGYVDIIYDVICKMVDILTHSNVKHATVDMCVLNHVLYTHFQNKIVHGLPVNTIFNKYDKDNQIAWFSHK